MVWNQANNKNPGGGRQQQGGPPDLDALLRNYKNKLLEMWGGKGTKKSDGSGSGVSQDHHTVLAALVLVVLIIIWAVSGIFIVAPTEQAVVLRMGKYVQTVGPGPHWIAQFVGSKYIVNMKTQTYTYQSDMLTKDENIVSVSLAVQYRVNNPRDSLFNVVNAVGSLQQATASALRQVVGHSTLDGILTNERLQAREQIAQQLQNLLNRYRSGLIVTDVTLQSARPPEAVTAAFDDAIKAREDQQSYINKANAYANQVTAQAQGQAARITQEANAYQQEVVLNAKAQVAGFLALLPEYQKAPEVMRQRMYLSTIESVLSKSSKILVDTNNASNVMYLPLDQLLQRSMQKIKPASDASSTQSSNAAISNSNSAVPDDSTVDMNAAASGRPDYPSTRGSY